MKSQVRWFRFVAGVVGAIAAAQLVAEAVTITSADCKDGVNCQDCLYRIENNAGVQTCRSYLCSTRASTFRVCIYDATKKANCNQAPSVICDDCNFSTCGNVVAGTCQGCQCPANLGTLSRSGWAVC